MLIFTGNLGERQRNLNEHVNAMFQLHNDFNDFYALEEICDVDKFIKTDLASKLEYMEYIIRVLKSGDSLHVTRALKCTWIYDDRFAEYINPDYLFVNVYPDLSLRMKRKMLVTMATHVKNPERAAAFFQSCVEMKLYSLALKFAVHTSFHVKLEIIRDYYDKFDEIRSKTYFQYFVGSSFVIADTLLNALTNVSTKLKVLRDVSYLYALSDEQYMNMLEKHIEETLFNNTRRLGSRVSKLMLKKYSGRVLGNLKLYVNFLHMKSIARYTTIERAKTIVCDLLPEGADDFWHQNFCIHYAPFFNKVPEAERFRFMKQVFNDKYSERAFETDMSFYNLQYYNLLTVTERAEWAIELIGDAPQELSGYGRNYILYKFVGFDGAYENLTRIIRDVSDMDVRANMVRVILDTVKDHSQLTTLLNYYYENHSMEQTHIKENFVREVLARHKVYDFNYECWTALNRIFENLQIYSGDDDDSALDLKVIALVYHIIHNIDVPESMYVLITCSPYLFVLSQRTDRIDHERREMVYRYLIRFYIKKVREFDNLRRDVKYSIRKYICYILDLMSFYNRTVANIPDVVRKYVQADWEEFGTHRLIYQKVPATTEKELLRCLKGNPQLAADKLQSVRRTLDLNHEFHIRKFLQVLKVYFPEDILPEYLRFYCELLSENIMSKRITEAATYGIFMLADEKFKVDFMLHHAPILGTIDCNIDENLLRIQLAICATVFYSRPPVPLKYVLMYVKGDYIRPCLPLINSYLVNLPFQHCIEFMDSILKTPNVGQKHGVRLSFACFTSENLRNFLRYVWKKNKNVSLRQLLYKGLYDTILAEQEYAKTALFETLIQFTLEIKENDDSEIFNTMLTPRLPPNLLSDYMRAVHTVLKSLPRHINKNIQRMSSCIAFMHNNLYTLRQDFIRPIIEDFIKDLLETLRIPTDNDTDLESFYLYSKKWALTARHITYIRNHDDLLTKSNLALSILSDCLRLFNLVEGEKYIGRDLYFTFIRYLQNESYSHSHTCYEYVNTLLENITIAIRAALPIEQTNLMLWDLQIDMEARNAITRFYARLANLVDHNERVEQVKDIVIIFGDGIANIIQGFVDNDMFFKSLLPHIKKKLCNNAERIGNSVDEVTPEDVLVIMCSPLIALGIHEAYLFILSVIPSNYSGPFVSDYNSILNRIKNLDDREIVSLMYEKFLNRDCKARPFLQL